MKYICGSYFVPKCFRQGGREITLFCKEIASKSEKVPIFRCFYPKSLLMF